MIRRPPRSTQSRSSAASDVYKRQLYLMGAYDSSNGKYTSPFSEKLLVDAFKKAGKRLDMGKCCLHFKELDDLELTSVAKVIAMSTPKEYIAYYRRVKGLA